MKQQRRLNVLLVIASILACTSLAALRPSAEAENKPAGKDQAPKSVPPFTVPPGFVVERVAGPPLVERPMMAGFDDQGRLFVCDSSGFNLLQGTSDLLVKNPPHAIRLLEDTDGDGRFDKSTLFADKMTFPMGALWHDGSLYTASAPNVWRLEDTQGKGVADRRQAFVTRFDFGGNGCDLHGPFLGPDGRIYWANCQRAFAIRQSDGRMLKGKGAGVFRIRPDGKDVEMLCAGGFDNPVEVAFTAEGEAFATVDLFIGYPRPRTDAIIHCIEGGLFPYNRLDRSFKRTGDLLPAMIDLGWVAPAGLMRYRGSAFGAGYHDNLFSTQFNTRRVVRHVLERDGATFRGRTEDFLVSTDPDFHPTDVLEDADGSLLVIDTGGWFLRGCPTSQIAKPEIKGAIYRIRRKDAPKVTDPRGLALKWDTLTPKDLAALLDDARWVVRDRAVHQLGKRSADAVPLLKETIQHARAVRTRRNAVWALTRMDNREARAAVRLALSDKSGSLRLSATNSVGLWRDAEALEQLKKLAVLDELPPVRREAATALGRIGKGGAVPALLEALHAGGDRFLEHAQIYALIRLADRAATLKGLEEASPRVRRAALLALDQMDNGNLTREQVVPLLESADADLQRTALTVVIARPAWADGVADLLRRWLTAKELTEDRRSILQSALLALGKQSVIQEVVANELRRQSTSAPVRLMLLETIAQAPVEKLPSSWHVELQRSLEQTDERILYQAIATVRTRNETGFDDTLTRLGKNPKQSAEVRLAALGAVAPRLGKPEPAVFDYLRSQLDTNLPVLTRLAAASALGNLRLDDAQLTGLADAMTSAGAVEIPYLLAAFERSRSLAVGRKLVAALEKSPGLESLSAESLRRTLKDYPAEVRASAARLVKRLQADADKQKARLTELEPALSGGNKAQGRTIFFGAKAACSSCHTVASVGGKIGPDLSKIGSIRTPRDLLESIVVPSASIVRGYEPYVITTKRGRSYNGILGRDTPEAVTLVTTERTEIRIPRSDIEEIQPNRVSIMPTGLDTQFSRQELSDLIAFLASLK
ncbi:MAG: HEAT repeat domain-containing protein [Planctomycetes bacterium]|nr:HEAT repeat domain-containing protein [Planctomycetota bacterium]